MVAQDVYHTYFEGTYLGREVLRGVSLEIRKSELVVLVGANGAGKTTLGRILAGLLQPSRGRVYHSNCLLCEKSSKKQPSGLTVGFVHQKPEQHFFSNTVHDELMWRSDKSSSSYGIDPSWFERVCTILGVNPEKIGNRSPFLLSSSEQRRVALAGFFIHLPDILILDEPLAYLSKDDSGKVTDMVMESLSAGTGVLVLSHRLTPWENIAEKAVLLKEGRITGFNGPESLEPVA